MLLRQLLEEITHDDVIEALDDIEPQLSHEARYRRVDVDLNGRTVYWVTQEVYDPGDLRRLARQIAGLLLKAKLGLWTVKTCVRDDYTDNESTDWQVYDPV